jgi:hypothetical protein
MTVLRVSAVEVNAKDGRPPDVLGGARLPWPWPEQRSAHHAKARNGAMRHRKDRLPCRPPLVGKPAISGKARRTTSGRHVVSRRLYIACHVDGQTLRRVACRMWSLAWCMCVCCSSYVVCTYPRWMKALRSAADVQSRVGSDKLQGSRSYM